MAARPNRTMLYKTALKKVRWKRLPLPCPQRHSAQQTSYSSQFATNYASVSGGAVTAITMTRSLTNNSPQFILIILKSQLTVNVIHQLNSKTVKTNTNLLQSYFLMMIQLILMFLQICRNNKYRITLVRITLVSHNCCILRRKWQHNHNLLWCRIVI